VYLLDANGGDAPKVAKALTAQGFGKVYVIQGGFNGWASAGLGVQ
jgi:rhodanese-related sulfurtransferase|tara:strand:- start:787 stop:921 length:135 start_codon:yes stop_codon:yes gene_type:complete